MSAFFRLTLLAGLLFSAFPVSSLHANGPTSEDVQALRAQYEALLKEKRERDSKIHEYEKRIAALEQENKELKGAEAVAEAPKPLVRWKYEVAAGGNYSEGNSNAYRANLSATANRETDWDKVLLKVEGEIGESEGERNAERIKGSGEYNREITERWYWLLNGTGERDAIADLDYRFTLGPGIGYYLLKSDDVKLSLEAGPAYVIEQLTDQNPAHSLRGRLANNFSWQVHKNVKLFQNATFLINSEDADDFIIQSEAGVETGITERISLRLTGRDTYDNLPAPGRKENDISVIGSIVYKFE